VEDDYESSYVPMVSNNIDDCEWIMDFGFSFYMTPNCLWFQEFTQLEGSSILLGDNQAYKIIGVGTIKFHLHDGIDRVLEKLRFVPSLKHNLISLGELENKRYVFKGEQGMLKMVKESMEVMKGVRKFSQYAYQGVVVLAQHLLLKKMARYDIES